MSYKIFTAVLLLVIFNKRSTCQNVSDSTEIKYENSKHKLVAQIPKNWNLLREFEDISSEVFIVQWTLPKIYSVLENARISNAVSITCLNKDTIKDLENLVDYEFSRIADVLVSKEKLQDSAISYVFYTTIEGLKYKSKSYFLYKSKVGYIVTLQLLQVLIIRILASLIYFTIV